MEHAVTLVQMRWVAAAGSTHLLHALQSCLVGAFLHVSCPPACSPGLKQTGWVVAATGVCRTIPAEERMC
jgi:hypothetical protein